MKMGYELNATNEKPREHLSLVDIDGPGDLIP
jgi:hypothetical protein